MGSNDALKKVLIICQFAGGPGMGMVSRPWKIGCALKEEYAVTIVCSMFSHTRSLNPIALRKTISSVDFYFLDTIVPVSVYKGLPRVLQSIIFSISLVRFCFLDTGRRPDLLFNSMPSHFQVFPVLLLRILCPRLVVVTDIRDLWSYAVKYYRSSSKSFSLLGLLASKFFFFCEKLAVDTSSVVTSVFDENILSEYYDSPVDHFFLLRNGFSPEQVASGRDFSVSSSSLGSHFDYKSFQGALVFVYSGSLSSSISIEDFLDVFVSLCSTGAIFAKLYIASPSPLKLSGLQSEFVSHLGPLGQDELIDLLSKADVAVAKTSDSPVFRKGVSLTKYSDYMLLSLPILDLVNCSSTPVTEAQCGVHALPSSRESISDALLKICSLSRAELFDLGCKGRSWALSNLNMEVNIKNLLKRLN